MNHSRIQKIIASFFLVLLLSTAALFGRPKKAEAIFGVGDFNVSDAVAIAKDVGFIILQSLNHAFVTQFIQKASDKYKLKDVLTYIDNAANTIYAADELAQRNPKEVYKLKKIMANMGVGTYSAADDAALQKLYADEAAQTAIVGLIPLPSGSSIVPADLYNSGKLPAEVERILTDAQIQKLQSGADVTLNKDQVSKLVNTDSSDFMFKLQKATDFLNSTPQGRKILATNDAQQILSTARAAAQTSLSASAYKPSYQCVKQGTDNIQQQASCIAYNVENPANYVTSQIDTKLQSIFDEQTKPNDGLRAILQVVAQRYAIKLSQKIIKGSNTNYTLSDYLNLGNGNGTNTNIP